MVNMLVDPIADTLTRIRNAQAVKKPEVEIPFSKMRYELAKILEKENFVKEIKKSGRGVKKNIVIILKYEKDALGILGSKRISKSGQRIYKSVKEIKPIRGGFGISIVSTNKGLMTNKDAKKKNLGGEVLCQIW